MNSAISYPLALQLANDAFDRDLLNSADSVVARIKIAKQGVSVDLPPAAQAILRYHNEDKLYYQVVTDAGKNISGDQIPLPAQAVAEEAPLFRFGTLNGQKVRIASLTVQGPNGSVEPLLVQVAETLKSRQHLSEHILSTIVLPQLTLILIGAVAISFGISRGLVPLSQLGRAIASRTQFDLSPIDERRAPIEVRPIVIAINDLLGRLREDIEAQRRFVANAAHQLRTPVAGTKTYVGLAQRHNKDVKVRDLLTQIDGGLNRMTRLINQLLSLAKAEPRAHHSLSQMVDLNTVTSEAAAVLVSEAVEKKIDLDFESSIVPCLIAGESGALYDLVSNILDNAIRYTPAGGKVLVRVLDKPQPTVCIQDSGPGIAEDQRELVFERFYRIADVESSAEGSGLGLSIVREIARSHGALVSIDSAPDGDGTMVKVLFPLSDRDTSRIS